MAGTNDIDGSDSADKAYAAEPVSETAGTEPALEPLTEAEGEGEGETAPLSNFNPTGKGKGGRGRGKRAHTNAVVAAPAAAVAPEPVPAESIAVQAASADPAPETAASTIDEAAALLASATAKLAADIPETDTADQPEETIMDATTTTTSSNFSDGVKGAMFGAQMKAKDAFAKSTAAVSEYGEFAKGNVEAMVESGKILASGMQEMSSMLVSEGKTAIETMTSDVKQLAAVKSPTDFVQVQSQIVRRNFDSAIALSTKNSEALFKLVSDAFAPITGRVNLAVEKVRKVA